MEKIVAWIGEEPEVRWRNFLTIRGYDVKSFPDADSARNFLEREEVSLVVSDLVLRLRWEDETSLSHENGLGLISWIRRRYSVPIIATSRYTPMSVGDMTIAAVEAGANGYYHANSDEKIMLRYLGDFE